MPIYLKNDLILVRYPFSNLTDSKIRPAVIVHAPHSSSDCFIVPLTSQVQMLREAEFVLNEWKAAGLNVPTAVKRGIYTIHPDLILKNIGHLLTIDAVRLEDTLRIWLGL
ncbi:MAG: type II toxin-antitoxin system PemK/MazF family toxin [Chloroherpetonaceae bacterium]